MLQWLPAPNTYHFLRGFGHPLKDARGGDFCNTDTVALGNLLNVWGICEVYFVEYP